MLLSDTGWFFPVPEEADLPTSLRGLFAKAQDSLGFVPNVFQSYAFRAERFSAWFTHYRQLHEPTENLSAADREMIAVVVSAANGCMYCLVAHGAQLRTELGDAVKGDRVSYDWRRAGLDANSRGSASSPRSSPFGRRSAPRAISPRCTSSGSPSRRSGTWSRSPACTTSPTECRWRPGFGPTRNTTARVGDDGSPPLPGYLPGLGLAAKLVSSFAGNAAVGLDLGLPRPASCQERRTHEYGDDDERRHPPYGDRRVVNEQRREPQGEDHGDRQTPVVADHKVVPEQSKSPGQFWQS